MDRRRFAVAGASVAAIAATGARAQAPSGKLVLYTSQPEKDANQTVAAYRKANPGVEVEIFRSGTTEIMAKLAAEFSAGQPRPDVLLIADSVSMESLKAGDRLESYAGAKTDGFDPQSFDSKDKTYFGTKLITTGIAYNKAAKIVPASWTDLMKPELKGQISMPSPLYSGAAAITLGVFSQRPDLGWKFFEALKANETVAVRGNGAVLRSVATGEKPYGILVDFMAYNAKAQGSPVEFVAPKEGVTAVTEPVCILKTASNKPAARAFIDFILSEDGQKLALSQGYLAARESVGRPAWLPEGAKLPLMPMDIAAVLKTTDADKKRFADMFGAA
ncbi:MAG: ABC transporter substrate-binding protein [Rhizobiales bacterium 65-9]|nr:ABC transporter substrate-binding protein [Hyphomicrobiales bacterium]OJY35076.1 MAG: ABC transporter substrate-binding protein [Rhizobiales bacterium 65-9]